MKMYSARPRLTSLKSSVGMIGQSSSVLEFEDSIIGVLHIPVGNEDHLPFATLQNLRIHASEISARIKINCSVLSCTYHLNPNLFHPDRAMFWAEASESSP